MKCKYAAEAAAKMASMNGEKRMGGTIEGENSSEAERSVERK